jgi:hypothetical protein
MDCTGTDNVSAAVLRNVFDATLTHEVPDLAAIDLITDLRTLGVEIKDLAQLSEADTVTHPCPSRHGIKH